MTVSPIQVKAKILTMPDPDSNPRNSKVLQHESSLKGEKYKFFFKSHLEHPLNLRMIKKNPKTLINWTAIKILKGKNSNLNDNNLVLIK